MLGVENRLASCLAATPAGRGTLERRANDLEVPSLIYTESRIADNVQVLVRLEQRLRAPAVKFAYAVKACAIRPLLAFVGRTSLRVEVQSRHELVRCLQVGIAPERVVWNGPAKGFADLRFGITKGVCLIIDSLSEGLDYLRALRESERTAPNRPLWGLRLSVPGEGETSFVPQGVKLGMDLRDAQQLLSEAKGAGRAPRVLHCHALARCCGLRRYERYVLAVRDLRDRLEVGSDLAFPIVDLGGGWDARVVLEREARTLDDLVAVAHRTFASSQNPPTELWFEPGRFVVEDAALALGRIIRAKELGGQRWLAVDIATNLLVPLPLARFEVAQPATAGGQARGLRVTVCDGTCSPAGTIVNDVLLPEDMTFEGSILVFGRCGAYTAALAEPFFSPPAPVYWYANDRLEPIVSRSAASAATDLLQGFSSTPP